MYVESISSLELYNLMLNLFLHVAIKPRPESNIFDENNVNNVYVYMYAFYSLRSKSYPFSRNSLKLWWQVYILS